MSIWNEIIEEFKDFPQELRHQERARSIRRATDAFLEAKIPTERIIALLQKHWDLRRSEAEKALWQAENRAKRN